MPNDPHEVIWFRDENGHPQQATRANAEANHPEWKPMSDKDFAKTFPQTGDEENPEERG
jgi:hypothetical protein